MPLFLYGQANVFSSPLSLEILVMSSWTPSLPSVSFKYIAAAATSSAVTFPS